jgi:hypothetical protein
MRHGRCDGGESEPEEKIRETGWNAPYCSRVVLNLPVGLLSDENVALRVELVAESRTVRVGWLELADVLESPPEIPTRRRLLKEVLEDPVSPRTSFFARPPGMMDPWHGHETEVRDVGP